MPHTTYMTPYSAVDLRQHESTTAITEIERIAIASQNRRARMLDNLTTWAVQVAIIVGIGLLLSMLIVAVIVGISYALNSDRSLITIIFQAFGQTIGRGTA